MQSGALINTQTNERYQGNSQPKWPIVAMNHVRSGEVSLRIGTNPKDLFALTCCVPQTITVQI